MLSHYFIPVADYPTGVNNTIYFDTLELSDYDEGLSGARYRKKVRLRRYQSSGISDGPCVFEIKQKHGQLVSKEKVRLALAQKRTPPTIQYFSESFPDIRELLVTHDIAPAMYYPKIEIQYSRARYIDPQSATRLNLDLRIKSTRCWLGNGQPLSFARAIDSVLVEIKGPNNPSLPNALVGLGAKRLSLSKYCFLLSCFIEDTNLYPALDQTSDSTRLTGWR